MKSLVSKEDGFSDTLHSLNLVLVNLLKLMKLACISILKMPKRISKMICWRSSTQKVTMINSLNKNNLKRFVTDFSANQDILIFSELLGIFPNSKTILATNLKKLSTKKKINKTLILIPYRETLLWKLRKLRNLQKSKSKWWLKMIWLMKVNSKHWLRKSTTELLPKTLQP